MYTVREWLPDLDNWKTVYDHASYQNIKGALKKANEILEENSKTGTITIDYGTGEQLIIN